MRSNPIQRDDAEAASSPEAVRLRNVMDKMKERSRTGRADRPGDLENTPRFDSAEQRGMRPAPGSDVPPPTTLSPETLAGLRAVGEVNQREGHEPRQEEGDQESASSMDEVRLRQLLGRGVSEDKVRRIYAILHDEDEADGLRKTIEARLAHMDIGEFLMSGRISQTVQLIPPSDAVKNGFSVVFQTPTEAVEVVVDRILAEEVARVRKARDGDGFVDAELTQREYVRRQNELALAAHISAYGPSNNPSKWHELLKSDGSVDENVLQSRLGKVRQLGSPVIPLLLSNLSWFLERVARTLEVTVLGNG